MEKSDEKNESTPVSVIGDVDLEREILAQDEPIQNRNLPLMDLDKGLVGWESAADPMNPTLDTSPN